MNSVAFAMRLAAAAGALCVLACTCAYGDEPSAAQILAGCQAMLPVKPVELKGAIVLRNRKGIVQSEYGYTLVLDRSRIPAEVDLTIHEREGSNVLKHVTLKRPGPIPEGRVMDTDVTWLDLSLDYLWWTNPRYEADREGESVHGQKCSLIFVDPPGSVPGVKGMRLWVDKKNGCMMQAEELGEDGKAKRRIWGTRVKKFGERWMANVLETETLGSGRRTKITVDALRELP